MLPGLCLLSLALPACLVQAKPVEKHPKEQFSKRQATDGFAGHASSATLSWYPCYDGFQCARLQVPFDYSKPVSGDIFELAILKIPARTDVPYKGSFFLTFIEDRPIDFAQSLGPFYQTGNLAGYDILAWDPRGNGYTAPSLKCFASDAAQSDYVKFTRSDKFTMYGAFNGSYPATSANIKDNIRSVSATMKTLSDGCAQFSSRILPYMGTADNARDLNTIIKQLPPGKISMLFYGYPTAIGITHAAMFPNDFDSMTFDGAINAQKLFASGLNTPDVVQDGEKALQVFFDSCAAAGPCAASVTFDDCQVGCYFWEPTADAIRARYERLKAKYYNKIWTSVPPNPVCGDCAFNYGAISNIISGGMALPADGIQFAKHVSQELLELEMGTAIAGGSIEYFALNYGATTAFDSYIPTLRCLDQSTVITGIANLEKHMLAMNSTSSQTGLQIASQEIQCNVWPSNIKLKNPYVGNFNTNTRGSMVFLANTADPFQPIENAKQIASHFPNSRVVTINQLGSTSFFSGFSSCVNNLLDNWTINGVLPPVDSFCNDVTNGAFGIGYVKDYR